MSFFPCYVLFNEHAFKSDQDECFPFDVRRICGEAARPAALFKQGFPLGTSCSPVLHVESLPSSMHCFIYSLECTEREGAKESMSVLPGNISPAHCSAPSQPDIPGPL